MKRTRSLPSQSGVMLVEVLIAILIFSVGLLGIVGMQGMAIQQVTDARFRTDAALLANQLIARMWVTDRSVVTLENNFATDKPVYDAWVGAADEPGTVLGTLPAADQKKPTVDISTTGVATITLFWRAPGETDQLKYHQYVAITQVR
jgi:type IV pilus assembly protein PilV